MSSGPPGRSPNTSTNNGNSNNSHYQYHQSQRSSRRSSHASMLGIDTSVSSSNHHDRGGHHSGGHNNNNHHHHHSMNPNLPPSTTSSNRSTSLDFNFDLYEGNNHPSSGASPFGIGIGVGGQGSQGGGWNSVHSPHSLIGISPRISTMTASGAGTGVAASANASSTIASSSTAPHGHHPHAHGHHHGNHQSTSTRTSIGSSAVSSSGGGGSSAGVAGSAGTGGRRRKKNPNAKSIRGMLQHHYHRSSTGGGASTGTGTVTGTGSSSHGGEWGDARMIRNYPRTNANSDMEEDHDNYNNIDPTINGTDDGNKDGNNNKNDDNEWDNKNKNFQDDDLEPIGGVLANAIPLPKEHKSHSKKKKSSSSRRIQQSRSEPQQQQQQRIQKKLSLEEGVEVQMEGSGSEVKTMRTPTISTDYNDMQQQQKQQQQQQQASNEKKQTKSSSLSNIQQSHPMPISSIQKLRNLAQSTLMNSSSTFVSSKNSLSSSQPSSSSYAPSSSSYYSTNTSSTAVFYASILYTKSKSIPDAYLYAKALCYNDEYRRAISILDYAGVLNFYGDDTDGFMSEFDDDDDECENENEYNQDEHKDEFHNNINYNDIAVETENVNGNSRKTHEMNNHDCDQKYRNAMNASTDDVANDRESKRVRKQQQKQKRRIKLVMESVILACYCWSYLGEWEEVGNLLEHFILNNPIVHQYHHYYHDNYHNNIDSTDGGNGADRCHRSIDFIKSIYWKGDYDIEDEEVLCQLAFYIHDSIDHANDINPVSRLCFLRGRACDEASNPNRAVTFLKLALWIDVKCIEAWEYLCKRHLLTWEQERELVHSLRFDGSSDGLEWLKDVYLASLANWSMVPSSFPGKKQNQQQLNTFQSDGAALTPIAIGASPILPVLPEQPTPQLNIDASAIQFQPTPIATQFNFNGEADGGSSFNGHYKNNTNSKFHLKPSSNEDLNNAVDNNKSISAFQEEEEAFQNLNAKHNLSNSPEILTIAATRAYNSYNLPLALHYCHVLYEVDPLCSKAAHIQIATLTGLGHKRPLFRLAHALVDADPKFAMAWYAVGCYYYTCGRFDLAQRHLCRATRLDPRSAECWVAFGCAFASCDENDQANACFRAAQRLHSGSHYPMLYMGMEHLRTNNIPLAGHFLNSARSMGKNDPLCCNELGVWAYRKKEWLEAVNWFVLALRLYVEYDVAGKSLASWNSRDKIDRDGDPDLFHQSGQHNSANLSDHDCVAFCDEAFWEPTIFNLGQSYRKARRFQEASTCFEKCLVLCPGKATSYSALGFTRHLVGDLEGAIEFYHQSLSRKPDDPFASDMLNRALNEALDNMSPSTSGTNDGSFNVEGSPMTPANRNSMSMGSTISNINFQGGNSMSASANGRSFFSPGDSDVDMSMS